MRLQYFIHIPFPVQTQFTLHQLVVRIKIGKGSIELSKLLVYLRKQSLAYYT